MARKTHPTGCWTFFCNPRKWAIDEFLSQSGVLEDSWRVNPWQKSWFEPGQLGVIRVGRDTRTLVQLEAKPRLMPGIYAIVEVLAPSEFSLPTGGVSHYKDPSAREKMDWRVRIRYHLNLLPKPLLFEPLKEDPAMVEDPYLIPGIQARSMPLRLITFQRILELTDCTL